MSALTHQHNASQPENQPLAAAIDIRGVSMVYTTRGERLSALTNVTLDIAEGEFVSLIGPSGCGKSTLLRVIADLLQPSSGTVEVHGKSADVARRERYYGMVFQSPVLYDWRTVERNVQLPLEIMKVPKRERSGTVRGAPGAGRPGRFRQTISVAAQRRNAAACCHRPCPVLSALDPADGRAVWGAG